MAEIVLKDRSIRVKIVYYGPALGGKTTNLQQLHARASANRRGELLSVNSFQDRTVLFDMLPLQATGPRGFEIRLQLVAVPGQAAYALSRKVALRGADGIVFVANSARDRSEENRRSLMELESHLSSQGQDPASIPLVMQYNKRDLPEVSSTADMDRDLNRRQAATWTAVALRGEGVVETLRAVLLASLRDVWRRYPLFSTEAQASPENWVREALASLFTGDPGKGSAHETATGAGTQPAHAATPAPAADRVLRVGRGGAEGDQGSQGLGVAESYAEACSQLARAYNEAVTGRRQAESRLADLERAALIADEVLKSDIEGWLRRMLGCLGETAEAAQAAFAGVAGTRIVTLPPLARDPLLSHSDGRRLIAAASGFERAELWEAAERSELAGLLANDLAQPFSAVAVVPVRGGGRALGQVLLYFVAGDRLPNHEALAHLGAVARVFAPPLQLALMQASGREQARPQLIDAHRLALQIPVGRGV